MPFLKNRTVVGVICILLSLLICFGLTPLLNKSVSQKAEILWVVQPIRAGDIITRDMIQTVEVGGYNLPDDVLRSPESVVGRFAAAGLLAGDYILSAKITDEPAGEGAYLHSLDGSKQALSITIKSLAAGVSGKLQRGDVISIIAPDYRQQGKAVTPPELQYVEVIAVTAASGRDANTQAVSPAETERELPATVTLLASPEQARVLAELEAAGQLHLALVYRGSRENAAKFIEAQAQIIAALYPATDSSVTKPAVNLQEGADVSNPPAVSGPTPDESGEA